MIQVLTINILVMISRGRTEKKQKWTKTPQDKSPKGSESRRTKPQKWENILSLQQSRCMIPWSHDTGVDNQHSRHAITWPHREKWKWTKAPEDKSPKPSESRRTKPPKMRKHFKTPTIKVYDPMITWYRCGQSTLSSCHHVAAQRKAKMGQKHHRTKALKHQNQGGQNKQKWENILRLQQSRCTIPWSHDTGVDNQNSHHAITWPNRGKAKMDKSTTGQKPQRIRIKADKTPKYEKIF